MRILGAALLLLGAVQLGRAWSGLTATLLFAAALLVPYLTPARLRFPLTLSLLAIYGYAAGARSGGQWLAILRDGVPRLLTAPRPALPVVDLVLPVLAVVVLIGLWIGVRAPGRFAPLAGGSVLYVGGALLTAGQADRNGVIAIAMVVCAVVTWSAASQDPAGILGRDGGILRGGGRGRAVAAAGIGSVAVVATASLLAPVGAFEPRNLVSPPPQSLVERSPLSRLATLIEQGDRELFRHSGVPGRLHLVALAGFDGAAWTADARYREIGAVAPQILPAGKHQRAVTTDVTIDSLDGVWLPTAGMATSVSLPSARIDPDSGSLLLAGGVRSGLRYQVAARVDTPADADLLVAAVPPAGQYLGVPRLPYLFAEYAERIVAGAATPFEQAVLIEAAVRTRGRLSTTAPAGSSYARLETFLFGGFGTPGAQAGTSEQFAAAFAVVARAAGLPTRVVFGFRPGQRLADGSWIVRARDALAWPEVYFTGLGWVPFDPTPQQVDDSDEAGVRQQVLDRVAADQPAPRPSSVAQPARRPRPSPSAAAETGRPVTPSMIGRLLLTTLAVIVAAVAVARIRRRIRHRRLGARGAWSEVLDLLVLLGRRPPRGRTAQWVAAMVPDAPAALRIADLADRAAFAPTGSTVDSPWGELRLVRRAARRSVPWYRRLTWPLDPRPLVRR